MTSFRGGSNGAGVPMPRHANSKMQPAVITPPMAITLQPHILGSANAPRPTIQRGRNHVQIGTKRALTTIVRRTAKRRVVIESTCYLRSVMSTVPGLPTAHTDPVNAKILAVSEDRIQGFVR